MDAEHLKKRWRTPKLLIKRIDTFLTARAAHPGWMKSWKAASRPPPQSSMAQHGCRNTAAKAGHDVIVSPIPIATYHFPIQP